MTALSPGWAPRSARPCTRTARCKAIRATPIRCSAPEGGHLRGTEVVLSGVTILRSEIGVRVKKLDHALLDIGHALNLGVEVIMRHEGRDPGNLDELGGLGGVAFEGAGAKLRDSESSPLGVHADALGCGHLHRLELNDFLALEVAGGGDAQATHKNNNETKAGDRTPHIKSLLTAELSIGAVCADHPPGGESSDHGTNNKPDGGDDVGELPEEDRVRDDLEEACGSIEFNSTSSSVKGCTDGMLHPRVRSEDPQGGEHRSDGDAPDGDEVKSLG